MCPPGTDQTTRSPPEWSLIAPAMKQQYRLTHAHKYHTPPLTTTSLVKGQTEERRRRDCGWDAFLMLARPDPLALEYCNDAVQAGARPRAGKKLTVRKAKSRGIVKAKGRRKGKGKVSTAIVASTALSLASTGSKFQASITTTSSSPISLLPNELHHQILTYLLHTSNLNPSTAILSFALTSRTNLRIATSFINDLFSSPNTSIRVLAPWANTPIACTSSYLTSLPVAFLTDGLAFHSTNQSHLVEQQRREVGAANWSATRGMCAARRFNWEALSTFGDYGARDKTDEKQLWVSDREELGLRSWTNTLAAIKALLGDSVPASAWCELDDAAVSAEALYPPAAGWVVRNLDTMETVRCRVQKGTMRGYLARSKDKNGPRLDDALLARLAWKRWMLEPDHICWAGDRLEIVSERVHALEMEVVGEEKEGEGLRGWKDVTTSLMWETGDMIRRYRRRGPYG